jgi:hypothetical protein
MLHLILGGAALERCSNCAVLTAALAVGVELSAMVTIAFTTLKGQT